MSNLIKIQFQPQIDRRRARGSARLREWSYMLELIGESGDLVKLVDGVMIVHETTHLKGDTWRIYEVISDRLKAHDIEGSETIIEFIERSVGIEFYADIIEPMVINFESADFCEVL